MKKIVNLRERRARKYPPSIEEACRLAALRFMNTDPGLEEPVALASGGDMSTIQDEEDDDDEIDAENQTR